MTKHMNTILKKVTDLAKPYVDMAATGAQRLEETLLHPGATILPGFPRTLQLDDFSCGAQCAYMVLKYYGKARSINHVTKKLGTTVDGTSTNQLRTLLRARGLKVVSVDPCSPARLRKAIHSGSPAIVCVDDLEHFAVVYGFDGDDMLVADPALNRSVMCWHSSSRFRERWDRTALIVSRNPQSKSGVRPVKKRARTGNPAK